MTILFVLLFLLLFSILLSLYSPVDYKLKSSLYLLLVIILIFTSYIFHPFSPDYVGYVDSYNEVIRDYKNSSEVTFIGISKMANWIFNDVCFLFLTYSVVGVSLKCIAIRQLTDFWFLSIVAYLSCFFMLHEMIQIRAGVATGLLLLCIKPLYERQWKCFLLLGTCACLFHYSAFIIFPLWFLGVNRMNKAKWILSLILVYSLYLFNFNHALFFNSLSIMTMNNERLDGYLYALQNDDNINISVFNRAQLIRCTIYLFLVFKSNLIARSNSYVYLLLKIYGIGLSALVFFASVPVIAFRVSEFFQTVEIILYPLICYTFVNNRTRQLVPIVICSFFLFVFYFKFFG